MEHTDTRNEVREKAIALEYSPEANNFHIRLIGQSPDPNPNNYITFARCFRDEAHAFIKYTEKNKDDFNDLIKEKIPMSKYFLKWLTSDNNPYRNGI